MISDFEIEFFQKDGTKWKPEVNTNILVLHYDPPPRNNLYIGQEYQILKADLSINIIDRIIGTGFKNTQYLEGSPLDVKIDGCFGLEMIEDELYFSDNTRTIRKLSKDGEIKVVLSEQSSYTAIEEFCPRILYDRS